jgi:hypothetical protein
MSIVGQDFEHHEVAHIFTDTHPSTMAFLAGGGKWAVIVVIKEAGDFIPCTSDNNERTPTKKWAYFSPPSIAGVSDWMVSVAMGSLRHGTFIAGFGAFKCLRSTVFRGSRANWVITSNVFRMMSMLSHAKSG